MVLLTALGAALAGGCKTGRERGPPPPFNPPYSWSPVENRGQELVTSGQLPVASGQLPVASGQLPVASGREPAVSGSQIQLASATEPLPLLEGRPSLSSPAPAEIVPAPMPPLAALQPLTSPPPLALFQAIEVGLSQNPDLVALRYAENASEGALGVAETYPFNPYVQLQVLPGAQSSVAPTASVNHYVLVQQIIQLARKQEHRIDAAAATLNSVRWTYVQAEVNNMAQTERLFFTALYLRGLAELATEQAELNQQLLTIAQKQFTGGTITGADLAIARLDQASARQQALLAQQNYETGLLDLKRQLGVPPTISLELAGRLADFRFHHVAGDAPLWTKHVELELPLGADQASIARSLASGRPDVLAAASDVATARATLDLARAARIPDLMIGPYYQRTNDPTTFWGFRAQMDIPVMNSGLPLVRQRIAELNQRQGAWEQLRNRATLEAQAAIERYERALALAADSEALGAAALPIELQKLEQQFLAGEIDLVRVVTARTSFFQARRAALDTQNEAAQASANLLAATALPPETLVTPDPGNLK